MSRVLVVEDSDVIARLLARLLEREGHEVVEVTQAEQLRNPSCPLWAGVDVLVCDLRMPAVHGVDILAIAATYFPNIRRIAFTGLSEHDSETLAAEAVADRVLLKPSDVARVTDVVRELLQ